MRGCTRRSPAAIWRKDREHGVRRKTVKKPKEPNRDRRDETEYNDQIRERKQMGGKKIFLMRSHSCVY